MSFLGSYADAKAVIAEVELSENTRSNTGSPILHGRSTPGGAADTAKPAHEVLQPGRLRAGIKTPRNRTDTLTRLYGATDREHPKG
jgi:hypothetical protein